MNEELIKHIKKSLRLGFNSWPHRKLCIQLAQQRDGMIMCAKCKKTFKKKLTECDHIDPIGEFTTIEEYIKKIYVTFDKLQMLCKWCHREKTNLENRSRRIQKFGIEALEKEIARESKKRINELKKEILKKSQ